MALDQPVIDKNYEEIDFVRLDVLLRLKTSSSVVFFGGAGCHFCEQLKPIYSRMASKYGAAFNFYYIDSYLPENSQGCTPFLDGGVPTLHVFWKEYNDLIPYAPTEKGSLGYAEPYLDNYFTRYVNIISNWEE